MNKRGSSNPMGRGSQGIRVPSFVFRTDFQGSFGRHSPGSFLLFQGYLEKANLQLGEAPATVSFAKGKDVIRCHRLTKTKVPYKRIPHEATFIVGMGEPDCNPKRPE